MKKRLFFLILATLLLGACAEKNKPQPPPPNYPDFSTPQAAVATSFYALNYKDYPVYLDSLAPAYQQRFGRLRGEQLKTLYEQGKDIPTRPDRSRKLLEVRYVRNRPEVDVVVVSQEMSGNRIIRVGWDPLKRLNKHWRSVYLEDWDKKR